MTLVISYISALNLLACPATNNPAALYNNIMKLAFSSLFSALLVGWAAAQRVAIGFPVDRTAATAGSNIIVEIDRPVCLSSLSGNLSDLTLVNFNSQDTLSASTEVAVVIAINSCHNTTCIPPADILGSILYNGPYSPKFQPTAPASLPPHQNFTVTIPAALPKGPAQLAVFHVSLIGVSLHFDCISKFTEFTSGWS